MKHLSGRRGWGTIHCGWKINITSCNTVSQQLLWLGIFLLKYSNFKIMTNLKNALNCKCRLLCVECEGGADFMAFDQVIWAKKVFWKKCTFMLTPILFQDEKPPHAFFLINRNLNKGMVRKYCSEFFVPCSFIQRVLFSYMQAQFILLTYLRYLFKTLHVILKLSQLDMRDIQALCWENLLVSAALIPTVNQLLISPYCITHSCS